MKPKNLLVPKSPDMDWLCQYFQPSLVASKPYKIDTPAGIHTKLDQNESPWDWPPELKQKILEALRKTEWNRYPESMAASLTQILAEYLGIGSDCIMTSPGSNHLIALILEALGRRLTGKIVIARPSFALFESAAQNAGLAYETWDLDENFDFRRERLPHLPDGSLVIFASPNNPTGTGLPKTQFRKLLQDFPKVLFLADEAYYEFDDEPYTDLLGEFSNLLILRTLSKTMGAAGIRLGYALGSPALIGLLTKLRLPYLLNHFTLEAAKVMLTDPEMQIFVQRNIENARHERERVFQSLGAMKLQNGLQIINSKANFLAL
ncbi:MAG: aminotransferase class I/II-fold pyridoxal phosphate-dependent enzyme, partial [Proteobacteria bacterium]|nr:aminotransferase class I/II-fold pyridoxal phosphate-dependent enzyme [Pseudomonadota bacterium]